MKITFLHLSDIHIHGSSDTILIRAEHIASTCFTPARESDVCLIVVTGDIAFSGERKQYDEAKKFLFKIKEYIQNEGCPSVEIITVPGNHDCTLKPENRSRSLIIEKIISDPEEASHEDLIDTCTEPQNAYFDFQNQITIKAPVFTHKLWSEYEFTIKNKTLRISAINAAWMSRIPEEPGQLVFPIELFQTHLEEGANIRLALLHHPLNWYCQSSYHSLRQLLRTHANIILSGHEHLSSSGTVKDTSTGSSLYFEAPALQPHEEDLEPSFSNFFLDYDNNTIQESSYTLLTENVQKNNETKTLSLFNELNQNNGDCELTQEFQKVLRDPGGYFTHPDKDNIELSDIFVYPDVQKIDPELKGEISYISVEKILSQDHKNQRLFLLGEEKSGKTITLLHSFYQYHSQGYLPLYIRGSELSSLTDKKIEQIIERQAKEQYLKPETIGLTPKDKKIAIIDDIDRIKGNAKTLHNLIQFLERHFTGVILSASSGFEINNLVNKDASGSLAPYETYEIQRFNLRLRHKFIKKWCLCGSGSVTTKPELDERIHEFEGLVNSILGKSLVPSQPIYLLILLQSCQSNQQNELQNSSFAYYYQYIITKNFGEVGVKREQLNELFNYLATLAWNMQENDQTEIALGDLTKFNREFCERFSTVDLDRRLTLLCKAKILIKRGEYYSFTYPYIYFFFLGKFLADNIHKPEIQNVVEQFCDNLNRHHNSHAILFLTHHNNLPWVIQRILSVLKNCFKECKSITFNEDANKINALICTTTHLLIDEPDVDKNQEDSRDIKDKLENHTKEGLDVEDSCEIDNQISFVNNINLLLKTAEIIGQILKNYYGSLERPLKQELIHEVFDGPLRLLGGTFESILNNPEGFVKEIEISIGKEQPSIPLSQKEEFARKITFFLLSGTSTGLILRTAQYTSSHKLHEDISAVVKNNPTNAYKLTEVATYLAQPGDLPLEKIRKLAKDLDDSSFAFKILQSLGIYHLYQYHMKEIDKQKLCSYLKIEISKSHTIDFKTKDSKLLK